MAADTFKNKYNQNIETNIETLEILYTTRYTREWNGSAFPV